MLNIFNLVLRNILYRRSKIFWTDDSYNRIWMASLDGSNATILISSALSCPGKVFDLLVNVFIACMHDLLVSKGGIAWDWINEKLYWTDFCTGVIRSI